MSKLTIGRVRPVFREEWDSSATYKFMDWVAHKGGSWIALKDVSAGEIPGPDSAFWGQTSSKGDKGDRGDKGEAGTLFFNTLGVANPEGLSVGEYIQTLGKDRPGDGGGAVYEITAASANAWDIKLAEGKYASIRNRDFVNYRMFGAVLDGAADDEIPLQNAHAYANANGVKVVNHSGVIYKASDAPIQVEYDVDLSGSTILVTNDNTAYRAWYRIGDTTDVYYTLDFTPEQKAQLKEGTAYFTMTDNSIPGNVAIKLTETNYAVRDDYGNIYMTDRMELMAHDNFGICSGPLIEDWATAGGRVIAMNGVDYTSEFQASYTRIPARTLTFIGCDLDIATTPNVEVNVVTVNRHNVALKNFTVRPMRNSLQNTQKFKHSVIFAQDCYNLTLENILGFNTAGRDTETVPATSGYMVRLSNCMKVTVRNCRLNGYWGATAGENVKDIHFENVEANRIDIHNYFRDLFISGCTLHNRGVQVGYGRGLLAVRDCVFSYQRIPEYSHANNIISLNSTYGRLFSGLIVIEGASIHAHQGGGHVNMLYAGLMDNGKCVSSNPYQLPEIRMRDITVNLYEPGYGLRLMSFSGKAPYPLVNMALAVFENIVSNQGEATLCADETQGVAASGQSLIYINNVPGIKADFALWFGAAGNDRPAVRQGASSADLTIDAIAGLREALNGKADATAMQTALAGKASTASLEAGLADKVTATALQTALAAKADATAMQTALAVKVNTQAKVLTAADNLDALAVGGFYSAPWDVGGNPDSSQGFVLIIPSNSAYSTCAQAFINTSSGNMKIRSSYWDSADALQWHPWRVVPLGGVQGGDNG